MSYGLIIKSLDGYTQIDETYSGYRLYSSGTTLVNGSATVLFGTTFGSSPIVMVKCPVGISVSGDVALDRFLVRGNLDTTTAFNVEYKIYVPVKDFPSGQQSYGIRVYDETGGVTFDSQHYPIRIAACITKQWLNLSETITMGSLGFHPYVSLNPLTQCGLGGDDDYGYMLGYTAKVNSDFSITCAIEYTESGYPPTNGYYYVFGTKNILIGK